VDVEGFEERREWDTVRWGLQEFADKFSEHMARGGKLTEVLLRSAAFV